MSRPAYREFWTDDRTERLVALFDERAVTLREIAVELRCSLSWVRRRLGELRELGRVGYRQRPRRDQTPKAAKR